MSDLTLRNVKGSPLTNQEVDDNFSNLNADKYQSGDSPTFTDVTADSLQITGGAGTQGTITWNDIDGTLDLDLGTATLQVGQEEHFYAKATEAIANGDVVMFAGAQGDHVLIAKANHSAVGFKPEYIMGVATQAFANNAFGYVTTFGKVRGLNTSTLDEGDILYSDPSNPGALTTTRPSPPDHIIQVAAVLSSNPAEGVILVRLTHFLDTDEVEEGSTNLYFTDARAVSAIQADASWNASDWDTAYSWGNHASAGYLTGYTESDPTVPSHVKSITTTEKANWNTAYGWGNHASAGYLLSSSYTASDVLTKIKTVDGSGSGLDADSLDGYQYTAFNSSVLSYRTGGSATRYKIRLPFATNSSKMLKFTISMYQSYAQHDYEVSGYLYPSTNQWYLPHVVYKGTGTPDIVVGRDGDGRAYVSVAGGSYTGVRVHSVVIGYTGSTADSYNQDWSIASDTDVSNSVTPAITRLWSSNNDGSGSGLDADLLDGYHASSTAGAANTVVVRDSYGYISNTWFRSTRGVESTAANSYIYDTGDGYMRSKSLLNTRKEIIDGYVVARYVTSAGASGRLKITLPFTTNSGKMIKFTISGYGQYNQWTYEFSGYLYSTTNNWYSPKAVFTGTGTPDIICGRDANGYAYVSIPRYDYMGVTVSNVVSGYTMSIDDAFNTGWTITADSYASNTAGISVYNLNDTGWNAGNDGSGSGLDADLLDGYQAAQGGASVAVVTTSSGYIAHDNWIRVGNGTGLYNAGGGYLYEESASVWAVRSRDSGSASLKLQTVNGTSRGWLYADSSSNQGFLSTGGSWRLTVPNSGNILRENTYTIWDSGNDGSGSGLDADSLDGYHASSMLPSAGADIVLSTNPTADYSNAASYWQGSGLDTNYAPSTDWYNTMRWSHGGGVSYYSNTIAIKMTGGQEGTIWTQTRMNGSLQGWNKYWHSNNDGSGSGLDADTLDGLQPSVSASNNTIVQRHSSGYIFANFFNTTPNDVSSGVTKVCVETGNDGYIRHGSPDSIALFLDGVSGGSISTATNNGAVNYVYVDSTVTYTPTRGSCGNHVYQCWGGALTLNLSDASWQKGDVVVVSNVKGDTSITVNATAIYLPNNTSDTQVTWNSKVGSFRLCKYNDATGYWMVLP